MNRNLLLGGFEMNTLERISYIFDSAIQLPFDNASRIVLISDCHRGDGGRADDFRKNRPIYQAALMHYYQRKYTYVELGDGDELWENKDYGEIIQANSGTFKLLSRFYQENRLYFIYGNHDILKRSGAFVKEYLYEYHSQHDQSSCPLFENIKVHEGIVLCHRVTNDKILLIHGHQVDFLNYELWRVSRFLVRYLWRPLNLYGVNDPTRTAKNYEKKDKIDRMLLKWVKSNKCMLIAGHTHRPIFPEIGQPPYFNDGSSVHPSCITAIEIVKGDIRLVKWSMQAREDGTLYIGRDVLEGPRKLVDYFRGSDETEGSSV
jgi:UDP-2,3-diacylglucosamine pyrophosphatase LpxH